MNSFSNICRAYPFRVAALSFLLVCAVHGLFIYLLGVDVPMWDQWDAEAEWYKHVVGGDVNLHLLLAPHNEHRLAVSRLFWLAIFKLMGGWKPIAAAYAQILWIAPCVAYLVYQLARHADKWCAVAIPMTTLVYCLPYSWSNILSGFQNQFYFMILFAVIGMHLAAYSKSFVSDLLALVFAALSPFAMAGGIATILALAVIYMLRFIGKKISFSYFLVLVLLTAVIAILHTMYLVHVPGSEHLRAQSILEFFISVLKIMGWPQVPIGFFLWAGIAYAIYKSYRTEGQLRSWIAKRAPVELFTFGMLFWLCLQIAAMAQARSHADLMSTRYQQTFSLIIPLFFLVIGSLNTSVPGYRPWLIFSILLIGVAIRCGKEWPYMVRGVDENKFARAGILSAVKTNNFSVLKAKDKDGALGYFNAERIWQQVTDARLRPYHLWLPDDLNKK